MALTPDKIKGLREHVKRGDPAEAANARRILEKNGIPVEEPAPSFKQSRPGFNPFTDCKWDVHDYPPNDFFYEFGGSRRTPPPRPDENAKKRLEIKTRIQAEIVKIIAEKNFTKSIKIAYYVDKNYVEIIGLNQSEFERLVKSFNRNAPDMMEAARAALKNFKLNL